MRTSDSIKAIAPAFLAAQKQVKDATKTSTNPHYRSKYAPLEEVIAACKEALNSNGITYLQGGEKNDGEVLHLSTMLLHESGEWIESTLTMRPAKNDPQGIGSAITYARRYSLASICGVASEEDDDGNAASHAPESKKPATNPAPKAEPKTDRRAQYGRIQVQKGRKGVKDLTEAQWDGLLCDCFDIPSKELIQELSPIALNAGIDKLIQEIDKLEGKQ